MKKLSIALYFDQSYAQYEDVFRSVVEKSYIPLLKLIKEKKLPITLFISLSLLENLEKYGYENMIQTIKELYTEERIELVSGSAYSYILPGMPNNIVEQQVILSEYSLAYYFGKKGGFDGDPSLMLRDIVGIYPTELIVNDSDLDIFFDLGYEYVLCSPDILDSKSTSKYFPVGSYSKDKLKLVFDNQSLTKMIISKSDTDVKEIAAYTQNSVDSVLCFNAEFFGHTFDQGILLFEKLLMEINKQNIELLKVQDFVKEIDEIKVKSITNSDLSLYQSSEYQKMFWQSISTICNKYSQYYKDLPGFEEIAIWKDSDLNTIEDETLRNNIKRSFLVNKFAHCKNLRPNEIDIDIVCQMLDAIKNEFSIEDSDLSSVNLKNLK